MKFIIRNDEESTIELWLRNTGDAVTLCGRNLDNGIVDNILTINKHGLHRYDIDKNSSTTDDQGRIKIIR